MSYDPETLLAFQKKMEQEAEEYFRRGTNQTFELAKLLIGLSAGGLAVTSIFVTGWVLPLFYLLIATWVLFFLAMLSGILFMVEIRNASLFLQARRKTWGMFSENLAGMLSTAKSQGLGADVENAISKTASEVETELSNLQEPTIKWGGRRSRIYEAVMKWGFVLGLLSLLIFGGLYMQT